MLASEQKQHYLFLDEMLTFEVTHYILLFSKQIYIFMLCSKQFKVNCVLKRVQ